MPSARSQSSGVASFTVSILRFRVTKPCADWQGFGIFTIHNYSFVQRNQFFPKLSFLHPEI